MQYFKVLATAVVAGVLFGGSDAPTPYTVDGLGITLPSGQVFPAHGHVNLTTSVGGKGVHFDPNNGHPGGAWIGKSFIPWSAFGLSGCDTVSWVQVSLDDEHHGEGGQSAVVVAPCGAPDPTPEPTVVPTPEPSVPAEEPSVPPVEDVPETTPPAPELAETGLDSGASWLLFAALMAIVGGGVMFAYRVTKGRGRNDEQW